MQSAPQGPADDPSVTTECKRHFCIVTETYPPEINGVALTLSHLVAGLLDRAHAVSLVRPWQQKSDRLDGNPDVTLVGGLPLPGYKGLQFGLPAGGVLQQLWMRRRPDVVYVATEGPLGWSAIRAARRLAIPIFSGFHTNYHTYSRHYGAGFMRSLVFRYLRKFHNLTSGTFVPNLDLRDRLQSLGFSNTKYLGRGVDSRLFDPKKRSAELRREWGLNDQDLALLYVGRIAGEKNIQLAVDAYRAVKRISDSARFIVAGDGPLLKSLQAEHRDLIFCGMQTGERLATIYASADVFLFPSETETFGNVVLEALASGLAVIAYDYAAARSHITDGENGALVPFGDRAAYIASTVRLVEAAEALQTMRLQARAHATSVTWARIVQRFESLLFEHEDGRLAINSMTGRKKLAAMARGSV